MSVGKLLLKYGAMYPSLSVHLKYKKEVGSTFYSLVSITAGVERNRMKLRASKKRKKRLKEN